MTPSTTSTVPQIKRGRGRPKGSVNKPKQHILQPRRNPRRQAFHMPRQKLHTDSSTMDAQDAIPPLCPRLALSGATAGDWYHMSTLAGRIHRMITSLVPTWSDDERFCIAVAFLEIGLSCLPDKE
ncbi:hypothetical protein CF319_g8528 [Tilletia indica]|uniref:Uncharacterized protein n=1 Tax=Tilletia indica TaxID=43049 RepID=A0A177TE58_9BASI|nr:hypothetical protein CF319_g8528 [Tilletia indica]KAE8224956.1 hypothetical protein CF326_g7947 [Tilletia indica]KAE8250972.1 hypothetical protein A4X13_0g4219 [Tilletia indica]